MKQCIASLLVLVMILSVAACGGSSVPAGAEAGTPAAKEVKIGIAASDISHSWAAGAVYYIEKHCADNGIAFMLTISMDAEEMVTALDDLAAWGATAIVFWSQWTGMEGALQDIIDMGIPVVNVGDDIACEGVYRVTGDNYDMGYQSARYIVGKAGEAANIAVMDVPSTGAVCRLRKQGFYDYLNELGYDQSNLFEVRLESFARDTGLAGMADILQAHPQIDAVYAMDDEIAMGCIQAITEAGRMDIKAVTGGGGCQEYFHMIADEQYASLGPSSALYPPAMVRDAIKMAVILAQGGAAEPTVVIPTTIVSAANVAEYLNPENTIY